MGDTLECCSCLNVGLKHRVGKGSREEAWEGGIGEGGHRKGQERSTKGFILPLVLGEGGNSTFQTFKKKKKRKKEKGKKKNPKKPKHHVKLREQ